MTALLPPNLLRLFAPRPPLPYLPPVTPEFKKPVVFSGIGNIDCTYEDDYVPTETAMEKQKRIALEKKQKHLELEESIKSQYPSTSENLTEDPYKTLFVSNLDYSITQENLETTFKVYGDLVSVVIVKDRQGKSKGYGFVQFARSKALEAAVREAKGLKLGTRRILVDVERGRTVKGWLPKKCGGGLGRKRHGPGPGTSKPKQRPSRDVRGRDGPRDRESFRDRDAPRDRFPPRDLRADLDKGRDRSDRGERSDRGDRGDRGDRDRDRGSSRGGFDRDRGGDRYSDNRGGSGYRDRPYSGGNRGDRPDRGRGGFEGRGGDRERDRGGYERKRYDR